MEQKRLSDTWNSREYPVLLAVAERLESGERPVRAKQVAEKTGIDKAVVIESMSTLDGPYLVGRADVRGSSRVDFFAGSLTERGRRTVGLWPSETETTDALISLLRQAGDSVEDPEEKTVLQRAAGSLGMVSRGVLTDVLSIYVRSQAGL